MTPRGPAHPWPPQGWAESAGRLREAFPGAPDGEIDAQGRRWLAILGPHLSTSAALVQAIEQQVRISLSVRRAADRPDDERNIP